MFRDASQRKFDVLLFWALDRLSIEGVLATLRHLERLTSCGVGYRSFTEQYFDSCGIFREAVIAIIATVAKQERLRISERVTAGLATARRKGRRRGRPRVYVNSDKIAALREGGASWTQVCSSLNLSKGVAQRAWAGARSTVTAGVLHA
jgi:DNA invertase Pin-like site-specific DNA recombinase